MLKWLIGTWILLGIAWGVFFGGHMALTLILIIVVHILMIWMARRWIRNT